MSERDESRRQIARRAQRAAGDRSAKVANQLMKLSTPDLKKLELDEDLRRTVDQARAVTAPGARRRSERALAGDLRRIDLRELQTRLANLDQTSASEARQFHLAEQWRATLIEGGVAAAKDFPGGAGEPLPRLVADAQRERATGRPPGAARALFRHIAAALKAHAPPPATIPVVDEADPDDDDNDDDDE